jgi:predicted nuclease with RNAse H fold
VRTVGVDLAAEAARTAVAAVDWRPGTACVTSLTPAAADAVIVDAILGAEKAGIDCPLGWPRAFVEFVAAHQAGHVVVPQDVLGRDWRRLLAYRVTDAAVREATGLIPLSVSADRIGHAAMRCAALLAQLAAAGRPADRSGAGVVVEVYPAASLRQWGLPYRGYKGSANADVRSRLVDALLTAAPWLTLGAYEDVCRRVDHALDAVIAALAARAVALGLATTPGTHLADAEVEGWIALPTCALAELAP